MNMNSQIMKKLCFIFMLFLFQNLSFSQDQHKVDSLITLLKTAKSDTNKAKLLYRLSIIYNIKNLDSAMGYARQSIALSEQIGYKKGMVRAYWSIGIIETYNGDYPQALESLKKAAEIGNEIKDKSGLSYVYITTGNTYIGLGNYPEGLKNYLAALKNFEEIKDKNGILTALVNIGNVYNFEEKYPEALKNHFRALRIAEELKSKSSIAACYLNIGYTYDLLNNSDKALEFYTKSLKINEELQDKYNITACYGQMGPVYTRIGNYSESLKMLLLAAEGWEELGMVEGLANTYAEIGNNYTRQKKYTEAYQYLTTALSITKQNLGSMESIKYIYDFLAKLDSASGNYEEALKHYKLFIIYRDSLMNNDNKNKLTEQKMQYEFDKKESLTKAEQEKKDAVALQQLQTQKFVRNAFMGGFLVVLLFAGLFFRQRNKIKKGNIALQVAKDRAEQSEQFKQQFLANMSHEIRTPMNAVMGMTSLVLDTPLAEKQKFYLEGIKKSSDTLLHIINDILDLSKIEAGKMELEKIDFSLSESLKQVKQTLNHRAEEKGLDLLVKIDPEINDVVMGDPVRLNQVLINLTGNAIKFTEKGSVSIEITKGNSETDLQFSIVDTGIGIPQEKMQTVFENFSQVNTSDTRKYGGTGLGLSISRQLVELMGGKISIASEEGSGTTFSFYANFGKGSAERLEQRLASEEQVDGHILDGLTILVVDDNPYNRIVAKDTLESKSNAAVVAAGSAAEAIDLLKSTKFDVVLMDVQMPVMNGFEATRFIRANFEMPVKNIPIIALTASVLRTDLDKCKAAGMDSYIAKPFNASQLIIGIAQVLNIALRVENTTGSGNVQKAKLTSGVTDLEYLSKFCEVDRSRMKKYIEMFLESVPPFFEKINVAIEINDHLEIANQLHGFKTKLLMMGMKDAKEQSLEIEMLCRQGKLTEIITLKLHKLIQDVETATNELAAF
jgi:signal transduction histidine kinase/CheY-like chemotaxis protein/HPt (histidine-containing phosphotransfer) domain-containing protein